ncbi:MAG TPA: ABC transporter ATP-binding protein [Thermomicrobiales bacterium]|nr:ABC transporter ATP-binding protein [Thermomicrobiales bacterium]
MIAATPDVAAAPAATPAAPPIIEAHDLTKRYGGETAVDGIDLAIAPGEIFGILGPNGAGKTTTLEMIEGLRAPDAGTIRIGGYDPIADGDKVRRMIGVQLQATALFDYLSAAELIALFAGLYDVDGSPARVDALLALVGLEEKRKARVDELSGGQKQRLAIAIALVNEPNIVFLDEPTTGLDPAARRALWGTIRDIEARGATVVLTTHYLEEAEALCDRVAVMERGRIIACDTPAELIRTLGAAATIRAIAAAGTIPAGALAALPSVLTAAEETTDERVTIRLETADVQATLVGLLALATAENVTLSGLSSRQSSLEDVYLRLTGHAYEPGVSDAAPAEGRKRRRRL